MNQELQEIPGANDLLPLQSPPYALIAALVVTAIGITLAWLRHRHLSRPRAHSSHTAFRLASAALDTLRDHADQLPTQQLAAAISLTLRSFLETTTGDPAIYETHEESALRSHRWDQLPGESRTALITYLQELTALKYAPDSRADHHDLLRRAAILLESTRHDLSA